MAELVRRFQSALLDGRMIAPGSRVLVAVSGGADSVALLALLRAVAEPLALHLQAAHLDHALRPESSDDARFVRQLCARLQVPLTLERQDVGRLAKARKANLEEMAREQRRHFLEATARRLDCDVIALGHHREDQAETVLLRLLRGAGPAGLSGMRAPSGCFVRPLIDFGRDELRAYLELQRLAWREDASNRDLRLTRNRIRHELLPLLQTFNPQIVQRLDDLAVLMAEDEAWWEERVAELLQERFDASSAGCELPRDLLIDAPPALAGRVVRAVLARVRGDLRRIERQHVVRILELARGERPQAELHLPGCWIARRYDRIRFAAAPPDVLEPSAPCRIDGPGDFPLPDGRTLRVTRTDERQPETKRCVEFAADVLDFPLWVRTPEPGDRVRPTGMGGRKKLQDLFVDLKLSREQRRLQPLLVCADEILWVIGVRRCGRSRPERDGRPVVRCEVLERPAGEPVA